MKKLKLDPIGHRCPECERSWVYNDCHNGVHGCKDHFELYCPTCRGIADRNHKMIKDWVKECQNKEKD